MSEGCWELNKPLELNEIANNSLSVLSVFSVVNYAGIRIFKNPQDRGKIHAVFGQIGRFLCWVEFQLHASNVCLIDSYLKPHFGGLRSVGAFSPSAFSLSQSHGEHGGVSEFPVNIFAQTPSVPLCLRERPTPPRLRGRDDHAPFGRRCAAEKCVMQDDEHLQCAGAPRSPKCLRNSATRLKVCSREAFILSVESW